MSYITCVFLSNHVTGELEENIIDIQEESYLQHDITETANNESFLNQIQDGGFNAKTLNNQAVFQPKFTNTGMISNKNLSSGQLRFCPLVPKDLFGRLEIQTIAKSWSQLSHDLQASKNTKVV